MATVGVEFAGWPRPCGATLAPPVWWLFVPYLDLNISVAWALPLLVVFSEKVGESLRVKVGKNSTLSGGS